MALFVGRKRELATLCDQLHTAAGGRAIVSMVTGEPGIGKTRLLAEMESKAAGMGFVTLRGGAFEVEGMPPYLPFLEALGWHIHATPADLLRQQLGPTASVLATILPELAVRLDELPPGYPLPADQARLRLFQAIAAWLAAIAGPVHSGLLLILDDLHWADAASLDLLWQIPRYQLEARLLILGAYRPGELAQNAALERALYELNRQRLLTTLALSPLNAAEMTTLAADFLGASADDALVALLHEQSEGNPFFAEELLHDWQEAGALVQTTAAPHVWSLVRLPGETLPPSIISAIRQRLTRLPTPVVDPLRMAAVIGRGFHATLLAQITGREVEEVEALLQTAVRAGLVRDDSDGVFTFGHDVIRECLSTEVSSARRKRLHRAIGLALEKAPSFAGPKTLSELAFHFARSDDPARGVDYCQRAAAEALRNWAPHDAMIHLRTALDLTRNEDGARGDLLLELGEAALQVAAEEEAAVAFQQAEAWFARRGDPIPTARAAHGRGMVHWRSDEPQAAEEALRHALDLLDAAGGVGPGAVRVRVDLASLLGVVLGRHDEAEAIGRKALDLVRLLDDARLEAAATCTVGFLLVRGNDLAAGIPLLEHAFELAKAHDDPAGVAEVCACLAQALCWSGQIERSLQVGRQREVFARRCQQPYQLCYVSTWLAFLHAARGRWAEAEQWLVQAGPAAGCVTSTEPTAFLRQVSGFLAFQRADYRLAEREFRAAVDTFRDHDPGELVLCLGTLGLTMLMMNRRREAEAIMAEQEQVLTEYAVGRLSTLSAEGCLGLMAVQMADHARAARIYPELLACQGQHHWFLVDRVLGQLALLMDDWSAAEEHLAAAESTARREGLRPELARVLEAQSELVLTRGGSGSAAHARELLRQATELYGELDLPGQVRSVRRKLRQLPSQPAGSGRTSLPAGLSRRESQVLKLVVAGMSNRQIAQELALSESTVAKHLTSIYNKTASENRTAAAAFAIRHDLA